MWVKICGITRYEDAVAAMRLGADAIGFVLTKSPRRADPNLIKDWTHDIQGIEKVGVFTTEDPSLIMDLGLLLGLDSVQLHSSLTPAHHALASRFGIIYALRGNELPKGINPHLPPLFPLARGKRAKGIAERTFRDAVSPLSPPEGGKGDGGWGGDLLCRIMIDGSMGTGTVGPWEARDFPFILAGGLRPGNVRQAIARARPDGVDVSSGVEVTPGIKDALLMERFIKEART